MTKAGSTAGDPGVCYDRQHIPPQQVKGLRDPVQAFQAKAIRATSRFEAATARGLSRFLDRWAQAKGGEGQVVLLSGEAGIDKSRMLRELHDRISEQPHISLLYQCSPFSTKTAFAPIIEELAHSAGFMPRDSIARTKQRHTFLPRESGRWPCRRFPRRRANRKWVWTRSSSCSRRLPGIALSSICAWPWARRGWRRSAGRTPPSALHMSRHSTWPGSSKIDKPWVAFSGGCACTTGPGRNSSKRISGSPGSRWRRTGQTMTSSDW